jgi:hypothetical protein
LVSVCLCPLLPTPQRLYCTRRISPIVQQAQGREASEADMKLKMKLLYDRRSIGKSVLVSGSHLEHMIRFLVSV